MIDNLIVLISGVLVFIMFINNILLKRKLNSRQSEQLKKINERLKEKKRESVKGESQLHNLIKQYKSKRKSNIIEFKHPNKTR